MNKILKFFKKFKLIKYISLLHKCNQLEVENSMLKKIIEERLLDELLDKITIPEQLQKRDRLIKRKDKQIEALKETIKIMEEK